MSCCSNERVSFFVSRECHWHLCSRCFVTACFPSGMTVAPFIESCYGALWKFKSRREKLPIGQRKPLSDWWSQLCSVFCVLYPLPFIFRESRFLTFSLKNIKLPHQTPCCNLSPFKNCAIYRPSFRSQWYFSWIIDQISTVEGRENTLQCTCITLRDF